MHIHCRTRRLFLSLGLLTYSLLCPLVLTARRLGIYDVLYQALQTDSAVLLFSASFRIVLLNCLRSIPTYLGTFLLSESLDLHIREKNVTWLVQLLPMAFIPAIYYIMEPLYGIRYDFGSPAALLVLYVIVLTRLNLFSVNVAQKTLTLIMPYTAIQFLDLVPGLTGWGFGNGEISSDIKAAAQVAGRSDELSVLALSLFCCVMVCSLINLQTLIQAHRIRLASAEQQRTQEDLYQTRLEALRLRSAGEAQSLVHDLRTPLTTIQGLVGLAEMMEENPLIEEYLERISHASENMNLMISDILYEDRRTELTVESFIHQVRSTACTFLSTDQLTVENHCPDAKISINRIRMVRAVVNLLENAWKAIRPEDGHITLRTDRADGRVLLCVEDNGMGMNADQLSHAFDLGWSAKGSTGLGLNYVRQVVEQQGATIRMESEPGTGTKIWISLEEVTSHG